MDVMSSRSLPVSCFCRFREHFSTFSTEFSTGSVFRVIRFVISVFGGGKSYFFVNIRQPGKQDNTVKSKAGGKMMVRGVNRKIIEITNVEGGYFEKVLFFVKDDKRSSPDDLLEGQASKYIAEGCALKYRRKLSLTAILSLCVKILTVAGFGFSAAILFH